MGFVVQRNAPEPAQGHSVNSQKSPTSDLFCGRATLRSERSENGKLSVGLWAVAEKSMNTPQQPWTGCRTADAHPWHLATAGQGRHVPCTDTDLGARCDT